MTEQKRFQTLPQMLIVVTREEEQRRLEEVLDSERIPISFQARGKGTAPSEIMDIFGLRGTHRLITVGFLPKFRVKPVFEAMQRQLPFHKKGGGIAITVPVAGLQNHILQVLNEEAGTSVEETLKGDEDNMKEKSAYMVIWVSVASGYSDDVIDTAREAGAKGGTVMKGRRRNSERVSQHFGISRQEEQDFVMIIVPREKKLEVMSAITRSCGLATDAHGVVLSLPVDEVMGLEG